MLKQVDKLPLSSMIRKMESKSITDLEETKDSQLDSKMLLKSLKPRNSTEFYMMLKEDLSLKL
jgi:hypothetical protein